MKKNTLRLGKIPNKPGVYFFLGHGNEILYIGKATSLKSRIQSYFRTDLRETRSALIEKMVQDAISIEWTPTDSVIEALLLEVNLIRTHKPVYNTRSKDDRSYNCLVITKDVFPRVLVIRDRDIQKMGMDAISKIYGPFPNAKLFKEALKIIRKIFQFYDTSTPLVDPKNKMMRGKIDFNRQIGLYPDSVSKLEYARTIRHLKLLFEGKKDTIVKELTRQMTMYARKEEFEKAQILKKRIFALTHIQDVSLIKQESKTYRDGSELRVEAYDVAHLSGTDMVGVMAVITNDMVAERSAYRTFNIKTVKKSNDTGALKEMLQRRFTHPEWKYPNFVVVDGGTAQRNIALKTLRQMHAPIPVVSVVKDEHHRPKKILGPKKIITQHNKAILYANAEAHRFALYTHTAKRRKKFLDA